MPSHRIPPIKVPPNKPFEHDLLNRENQCEELIRVIKDAQTPYVLAIDAPWGSGKTTFLRMMQAVCKEHEIPNVFFNAWQADFNNNALASMIAEIATNDQWKDQIKEGAKNLLSFKGVLAAIKAIPQLESIGELAEELMKNYDPVDEHIKHKEALEEFKESIRGLSSDNSKPLVFFIDELDRCRPIFAVEVLEKIKHVFDEEGIFFVVALNKKELEKTIKSVYGDIDSHIYLGKFFDREYKLDNNKLDDKEGFVPSTLEREGFSQELIGGMICCTISAIANVYELSVREQEHMIELVMDIHKPHPKEPVYPYVIALIYSIYIKNPRLFEEMHDTACTQRYFSSDPIANDKFPYKTIADDYWKRVNKHYAADRIKRESYYLGRPFIWGYANLYIQDTNEFNKVAHKQEKLKNSSDIIFELQKEALHIATIEKEKPSRAPWDIIKYYPENKNPEILMRIVSQAGTST